MKIFDTASKKMFYGTLFEYVGNEIVIKNIEGDVVGKVKPSNAKLIFNEREIPYMEVVK